MKEADFVFGVPMGTPGIGKKEMHEPFLIELCLPFISLKVPGRLEGAPEFISHGY
jgi:hypothetical protein